MHMLNKFSVTYTVSMIFMVLSCKVFDLLGVMCIRMSFIYTV